MALSLVLGPANSAKAGEVLGAYAQAAPAGALLVVPTADDAEHYASELAAGGTVLGHVTTFGGLASEIARRAGYTARRLSPLGRDRLVRRVVAAAELELLRDSAGSRGFAGALAALVAELESSRVTPARFRRALDDWGQHDPSRRRYARELSGLYSGYAAELARTERVDDELFAWGALDALRVAPARWGEGTPVFFYGFDDLTRLERDAVETLARHAGAEVTVSLTYEGGRAAFAARAATVAELRPLADRVLELEALDEHYVESARAALHHLERSLFEPDGPRIDPGEAIRMLEAGGARAQAELIGAEVLELLRQDVPAEEVVVVCRSPEAQAPLLSRVLRSYGIRVSDSVPRPLIHTTLGRSLLALARCAWTPPAPAQELLVLLRAPGSAAGADDVDAFELELRRAGATTVEVALRRLGRSVPAIEALRAASDPLAGLVRQARELFEAPHRGRAPQLGDDEALDARALGVVVAVADELQELGERPTARELIELLEVLELPPAPGRQPGAVRIAAPLGIRARRFRAVFVVGLQEGAFPLATAPEPFLSDERRREIAVATGLVLQPGEDALARERYLFYAAVSRATERLVLAYCSSDEEGNLELPSPFLGDVADVLVEGWSLRRRRRLLADVVWDPQLAPTGRERSRAAAAASAPAWGSAPEPDRTLTERALAEVRHRRIVSAGALETFASCPVRWLVERELDPARFEPEPDPLARGSYMHGVLEELLRRLDGPVTPESLPRALALLDELVAELPPPPAAGRAKPVQDGVLRAIASDLRRYLEHEARSGLEWTPAALELRFGFDDEEDSLPALTLGDGEEPILVRGVIDRVDVDPSGRAAIVRDYKSGSARPEHQGARWESDDQLQVALYMLVVRDLLGVQPVAGVYQPLGGGNLQPRGVFRRDAGLDAALMRNDGRDEDELDAVLASAAERAVELARRLRSGELEPCPQRCSRDGCRYPGICRSG